MQLNQIVRQQRSSIVDWMKGKEEYRNLNVKIKAIWRVRIILTIAALSSVPCLMVFIALLASGSSMDGWFVVLALSWFVVPILLGTWLLRMDMQVLKEVFPAFLSEAPNEFKEKEVNRLMESMNSKDRMIYSKKYHSVAMFKSCTILSVLLYLPLTVGSLVVFTLNSWIHIGFLIFLASFAFILAMNYLFYSSNYMRGFIFDTMISFALAMFLALGVMRMQRVSLEAFTILPIVGYGFVFYGLRSWAKKRAEMEIIPRLVDDLTHYFEGEDELELKYWPWACSNTKLVKKAIAQGHLDYLGMSETEIFKKTPEK